MESLSQATRIVGGGGGWGVGGQIKREKATTNSFNSPVATRFWRLTTIVLEFQEFIWQRNFVPVSCTSFVREGVVAMQGPTWRTQVCCACLLALQEWNQSCPVRINFAGVPVSLKVCFKPKKLSSKLCFWTIKDNILKVCSLSNLMING